MPCVTSSRVIGQTLSNSHSPSVASPTVMRQTFIVGFMFVSTSVLGPIMYNPWIFNGSANTNFYFVLTPAFVTAQVSKKGDESKSSTLDPTKSKLHLYRFQILQTLKSDQTITKIWTGDMFAS